MASDEQLWVHHCRCGTHHPHKSASHAIWFKVARALVDVRNLAQGVRLWGRPRACCVKAPFGLPLDGCDGLSCCGGLSCYGARFCRVLSGRVRQMPRSGAGAGARLSKLKRSSRCPQGGGIAKGPSVRCGKFLVRCGGFWGRPAGPNCNWLWESGGRGAQHLQASIWCSWGLACVCECCRATSLTAMLRNV